MYAGAYISETPKNSSIYVLTMFGNMFVNNMFVCIFDYYHSVQPSRPVERWNPIPQIKL